LTVFTYRRIYVTYIRTRLPLLPMGPRKITRHKFWVHRLYFTTVKSSQLDILFSPEIHTMLVQSWLLSCGDQRHNFINRRDQARWDPREVQHTSSLARFIPVSSAMRGRGLGRYVHFWGWNKPQLHGKSREDPNGSI
jgi:hypothetical protein